jgi:hypothetical protein
MGIEIDLAPQSSASTNPWGITFGATAYCQIKEDPKIILNKNLGIVNLDAIDETGLFLSKGQLSAVIPWSNIIVFTY